MDNNTMVENYSNETYSDESGPEDLPPILLGFILLAAVLLIILGTVGNILVCLAIWLDQKLHNLTNYFLLSFAVCDLLVTLILFPARIAVNIVRVDPSSYLWTTAYFIGDEFITTASSLHICFISVGRYYAIKNPFKQMALTKTKVSLTIGLVWMIALVSVIPYIVIAFFTQFPDTPKFCLRVFNYFDYCKGIISIEAVIITLMTIVVICSVIGTTRLLENKIKQQDDNLNKGHIMMRTVGGGKMANILTNKENLRVLHSERKATRVVWLVSFAFILTMMPLIIVIFILYINPNISIPGIIIEIICGLYYTNSVINPIIYTIFNKTFRKNFKNLLLCKYKQT